MKPSPETLSLHECLIPVNNELLRNFINLGLIYPFNWNQKMSSRHSSLGEWKTGKIPVFKKTKNRWSWKNLTKDENFPKTKKSFKVLILVKLESNFFDDEGYPSLIPFSKVEKIYLPVEHIENEKDHYSRHYFWDIEKGAYGGPAWEKKKFNEAQKERQLIPDRFEPEPLEGQISFLKESIARLFSFCSLCRVYTHGFSDEILPEDLEIFFSYLKKDFPEKPLSGFSSLKRDQDKCFDDDIEILNSIQKALFDKGETFDLSETDSKVAFLKKIYLSGSKERISELEKCIRGEKKFDNLIPGLTFGEDIFRRYINQDNGLDDCDWRKALILHVFDFQGEHFSFQPNIQHLPYRKCEILGDILFALFVEKFNFPGRSKFKSSDFSLVGSKAFKETEIREEKKKSGLSLGLKNLIGSHLKIYEDANDRAIFGTKKKDGSSKIKRSQKFILLQKMMFLARKLDNSEGGEDSPEDYKRSKVKIKHYELAIEANSENLKLGKPDIQEPFWSTHSLAYLKKIENLDFEIALWLFSYDFFAKGVSSRFSITGGVFKREKERRKFLEDMWLREDWGRVPELTPEKFLEHVARFQNKNE